MVSIQSEWAIPTPPANLAKTPLFYDDFNLVSVMRSALAQTYAWVFVVFS